MGHCSLAKSRVCLRYMLPWPLHSTLRHTLMHTSPEIYVCIAAMRNVTRVIGLLLSCAISLTSSSTNIEQIKGRLMEKVQQYVHSYSIHKSLQMSETTEDMIV